MLTDLPYGLTSILSASSTRSVRYSKSCAFQFVEAATSSHTVPPPSRLLCPVSFLPINPGYDPLAYTRLSIDSIVS